VSPHIPIAVLFFNANISAYPAINNTIPLTHPIEFTEHQRNVFCVFSGAGVSKLRDHLNSAPEYNALRESRSSSHFPTQHRRRPLPNLGAMLEVTGQARSILAGVDGDFDEQEPDEDDGFEVLDGSEMALDTQPLLQPVNAGIPPPPPPVLAAPLHPVAPLQHHNGVFVPPLFPISNGRPIVGAPGSSHASGAAQIAGSIGLGLQSNRAGPQMASTASIQRVATPDESQETSPDTP
jgi:hypothetical protein